MALSPPNAASATLCARIAAMKATATSIAIQTIVNY
jgi:hypothetical protein